MTKTEFEARFTGSVQDADAALVREGSLGPLFGFVGRTGKSVVLVGEFSSQAAKEASFETARLTAIAEDAVLAVHRTEAWMVIGADLPPGVAPSQSDRRREVVIVLVESVEHGRRSSIREIVRGPDDRPTGTAVLALPEGDAELEGPMARLLPRRSRAAPSGGRRGNCWRARLSGRLKAWLPSTEIYFRRYALP